MDEERVYTVDEANTMLADLRERLIRIREARQTMLRNAELVKERVDADGGGTHADPAYWEAQSLLRAEVEWFARQSIALRDPETGLLDFPGERDGRRVWLCWRLGEDLVAHWHDLESGFASRKPL